MSDSFQIQGREFKEPKDYIDHTFFDTLTIRPGEQYAKFFQAPIGATVNEKTKTEFETNIVFENGCLLSGWEFIIRSIKISECPDALIRLHIGVKDYENGPVDLFQPLILNRFRFIPSMVFFYVDCRLKEPHEKPFDIRCDLSGILIRPLC